MSAVFFEALGCANARPAQADNEIGRVMRAASHLHSAERRFVSDALFDFIRHRRLLEALAGADDPWALWLRIQGGLSIEASTGALVERCPEEADELAFLGSIDRAFARALLHEIEDAVAFLAASNERAPVVVRANRVRTTREALRERLAGEGVPSHPTALAPFGLVLDRSVEVHVLPSFRDGGFEIQDEGSQVVCGLVPSGARVVDACAGAGGKTLAIAADAGEVLAIDVRPEALRELSRRAARAGLGNVRTALVRPDGPLPREVAAWSQSADVVIVDAPCTGSGTLRRRPGQRFRIDENAIERFPNLQAFLLARFAGLVRPEGQLVYATCSVLRRENEDVVESFLASHHDFDKQDPPVRLWPHIHGTDGFFGATLVRSRSAEGTRVRG